jgi:hypothetical protein
MLKRAAVRRGRRERKEVELVAVCIRERLIELALM